MAKQRILVDADLSVIKEQLREVENLSQGVRLLAIYQVKLGRDSQELAKFYNVSNRAICNWINAYNTEGLDGLRDKQRAGRPSRLDDKQKEKLRTAITDTPRNYGYNTDAWNASLVNDYIRREFDVDYKKPQIYNLLHDMDMSFRRGQANEAGAPETEKGEKKKRTRSPKAGLVKEQMKKLKTAIKDGPRKCGYVAEIWTVPLISDYIKREFGMSYNNLKVYDLLNEIGIFLRQHEFEKKQAPNGADASVAAKVSAGTPQTVKRRKRRTSMIELNEEQKTKLRQAIADSPKNHGYTAKSSWSVPLIADFIKREFEIEYDKTKVYRVLYGMEIHLRQQKDVATKEAESDKTAEIIETASAPKKRGRKPKAAKTAEVAEVAVAPKKRGRKPKAAKTAEVAEVAAAPKKRGRKPKIAQTAEVAATPKNRGRKALTNTSLDEEQMAKLRFVLKSKPQDLGYYDKAWSVPLLISHIQREFGILYEKSRVYRLLYRMGVQLKDKEITKTISDSSVKSAETSSKIELNEEQTAKLKQAFTDNPRNHGYEADTWKMPLMCDYIKREFDLSCDKSSVYRLLYRLGIYLKQYKQNSTEEDIKRVSKKSEGKGRKKTDKSKREEEMMANLKPVFADSPKNHGYEAENWKVSLVSDYLKREFGLEYDNSKVYRLLYSADIHLNNLKEGADIKKPKKSKVETKLEAKSEVETKVKAKKKRAKAVFDEKQTEQLKSTLAETPRNQGYEADAWSMSLIISYIEKEFGIKYERAKLYPLLYSMGIHLRNQKNVAPKVTERKARTKKTLGMLDDAQLEKLKQALAGKPSDYGYEKTKWTVKLLGDYLKREFEATFDNHKIYRLLYSLGSPLNSLKKSVVDSGKKLRKKRTTKPKMVELNEVQINTLKTALSDSPRNYGLEADNWTAPLLIAHIKREFGILYDNTQVYRVLYGLGVRLRQK
ncbi:MAG: winged helix-turn-helix domain-containing protein [Prevotellaceae bacterium]|jgi:transposase|nr:winged helix-turn-helix domain-containing protein [Prevotellaceae bacterium]